MNYWIAICEDMQSEDMDQYRYCERPFVTAKTIPAAGRIINWNTS